MSSDDVKLILEEIKKDRNRLERKEKDLKEIEEKLTSKLEKVASLTRDEAKKELLDVIQKNLTVDIAKKIRQGEERIKLEARDKAREILADAMKHGATTYVAEYTVSTVSVDSEEAKGRIIGREGRNIRSFEKETGVEIELDEGNVIRLSSFDSIRREIARRSLEILLKDTRIQPSRIEEVVRQVKSQMEDILLEEGKKIVQECGVFNLPIEVIKLIGRFKFRTSYGQNLGLHTIEETKIGVAIAAEIGANTEVVRLGCLLHDIGKVVSDKEGSHVQLGVELLQKYKMPKEVINAVAEHHEDKPFSSIESVLVYIADAASGGRPGARHEDVEEYVKRIRDMEQIAKGFDGVNDAYAFEAGRELRVIIDPGKLDDIETTIVAKRIKEEIDKKLIVPGVVRVTAIREFRTSEPKE